MRAHWNCHAYCWKCMFEEGIGALGAYCKEKKWSLFTPRPKLHTQQEIMNLWRTCSTRMGAASVCMQRVRILVRMWMQDQLDAGAEFVLSPNCHGPSIWKHEHAWHQYSVLPSSCCGIHAWSTAHKACMINTHACAAHKARVAMRIHLASIHDMHIHGQQGWHAWHAWSPKLLVQIHASHDMQHSWHRLGFATWMDEDWIGRVPTSCMLLPWSFLQLNMLAGMPRDP